MTLAARLHHFNDVAERAAQRLVAPLLLVTRVYVAWQFLKSGWLKIADWETTQFLFEEEYKVPLVSPMLAAVGGTLGELVFPVLLILGLLTRYAAAGLFAVNIIRGGLLRARAARRGVRGRTRTALPVGTHAAGRAGVRTRTAVGRRVAEGQRGWSPDSMCAIARSGQDERAILTSRECMWPGPLASLLRYSRKERS